MKRIGVPNYRWPGGCFADGYHWRDGIGEPAKRPRTYNYWQASMPKGMDDTETNQFGIHEFMHLCLLCGAEPYLAANMASGSPREFHGCRTATLLQGRYPWQPSERRTEIKSHSACVFGVWATNRGVAVEI